MNLLLPAKTIAISALAALAVLTVCLPDRALADTTYVGTLTGANVRPAPVDTQGTGTIRASLQEFPDGDRMILNLSYSGLAGPALSAGLYGPAWVNSTASQLFSLSPNTPLGTSGTFQRGFTFPSEYKADFLRGLFYVQINSAAYPNGEIRSQLPGINYSIPAVVPANTIATAEISNYGGSADIHSSLGLHLIAGGVDILESFQFTAGDVGKTFTISQAVDNNFNTFIGALTDGVSSLVEYSCDINGSSKAAPELRFFHSLSSSNGIDLKGQQIDHIELRFNKLELSSPGSDPNRTGVWTDFSFGATVFIVAVPEPGVATLLASGFIGLLFRGRHASLVRRD
jgi:hypothetical protein